MKTQCPNCNALHDIDENCFGKRGKCNKCGTVFTVSKVLDINELLKNVDVPAATTNDDGIDYRKPVSPNPNQPSIIPPKENRVLKLLEVICTPLGWCIDHPRISKLMIFIVSVIAIFAFFLNLQPGDTPKVPRCDRCGAKIEFLYVGGKYCEKCSQEIRDAVEAIEQIKYLQEKRNK